MDLDTLVTQGSQCGTDRCCGDAGRDDICIRAAGTAATQRRSFCREIPLDVEEANQNYRVSPRSASNLANLCAKETGRGALTIPASLSRHLVSKPWARWDQF